MTKEERAEKKRLREIEEERIAEEFPGIIFPFEPSSSLSFTSIHIDSGDINWISLRKTKSAKWQAEHDNPTCERITVYLGGNLPGLARLIRALVVRYNAIAKDVNSEVLAVPRMEPLAIIEDPPNPPEVIA